MDPDATPGGSGGREVDPVAGDDVPAGGARNPAGPDVDTGVAEAVDDVARAGTARRRVQGDGPLGEGRVEGVADDRGAVAFDDLDAPPGDVPLLVIAVESHGRVDAGIEGDPPRRARRPEQACVVVDGDADWRVPAERPDFDAEAGGCGDEAGVAGDLCSVALLPGRGGVEGDAVGADGSAGRLDVVVFDGAVEGVGVPEDPDVGVAVDVVVSDGGVVALGDEHAVVARVLQGGASDGHVVASDVEAGADVVGVEDAAVDCHVGGVDSQEFPSVGGPDRGQLAECPTLPRTGHDERVDDVRAGREDQLAVGAVVGCLEDGRVGSGDSGGGGDQAPISAGVCMRRGVEFTVQRIMIGKMLRYCIECRSIRRQGHGSPFPITIVFTLSIPF